MGSIGSMGSVANGYGGNGGAGPSSREGGLTSGWLAAFGTGGYEDEPPLLEELGINFGHIKMKVCAYPWWRESRGLAFFLKKIIRQRGLD